MKWRIYAGASQKSALDAFSLGKRIGSWRIHCGQPFEPLITKSVIAEPEEAVNARIRVHRVRRMPVQMGGTT
jgi:hypothetical protein